MTEPCTYSDLPTDQCHHCQPAPRPGDPTKAARARRDARARDEAERSASPLRWGDRGGRS